MCVCQKFGQEFHRYAKRNKPKCHTEEIRHRKRQELRNSLIGKSGIGSAHLRPEHVSGGVSYSSRAVESFTKSANSSCIWLSKLWDTFKRDSLQAAKACIGERPRSRCGFVSTETLENIEESSGSNQDQHRALSPRTRTLLGRDKERYVRSLSEDVEGHLNVNDLRPAYRALKKLRSKSSSRASAIRAADGRLVSDMDGQMARWAEYFGQLFTVDPPIEQLHTTGLRAEDADPPIDETAPSLDEQYGGGPPLVSRSAGRASASLPTHYSIVTSPSTTERSLTYCTTECSAEVTWHNVKSKEMKGGERKWHNIG
ncbi:hypothetical protein GWK47_046104 [Chionoecetes opilio]|uniref:Uncharacterized protein n=1 Tax=Chionoecetes opilio TaxID=41210 RepID=A0A8J4YEX9_CHIOP|nr:hypothetical protein GWK47_046104 [Chionoecetes opilio]